jgi:hypothetical protein
MRLPLTAILALVATGPVLAAGVATTTVTPVYDQLVSYVLPEGFDGAFANASENFYIQEAVPAGETVDKWSEMITMTGMKGTALTVDKPLQVVAEIMRGDYQKICPDTLVAQSFGPSVIDGREALTVFLGCGTISTVQGSVSETAVIIFIKGDSDVFTLQWAEHGPAVTSPPDYDRAIWSARLAKLVPILICDNVEGEAAPYPSCVNRQ